LSLILITTQANNLFFAPKSLSPLCPPSRLFHPCECYLHSESMRIIRCGGHDSYDLTHVFFALSNYLTKDEKHFHMFYLNNTAIAKLENVFHDITFDYICNYQKNFFFLNSNLFFQTLNWKKKFKTLCYHSFHFLVSYLIIK
jgi:hypothetical protein